MPYRKKREIDLEDLELSDKSKRSVDLTGISVLIVDDDPGVRDLLDRILSERGAETTLASSAQQALDALEQNEPNLLISDIGMPEKDGYELVQEVRAGGHSMPAIALTAFVRDLDRERATQSGFQRHLSKPLEVAKLLELVKELTLHPG